MSSFLKNLFGVKETAPADPNAFNINKTALGNEAREAGKDATNRAAPAIDNSQAQYRNTQNDLINTFKGQMNGTAPSIAENQFKQAADRNISQQIAAAAASRNPNAGAVQRQTAQNILATNQQTAADAANLRLQEQQQAASNLAGLSSTARSQDIDQARNAANVELQQRQLNDQLVMQYQQLGFNYDQAQSAAKIRQQEINAQIAQNNTNANNQFAGGLMNAAATGLTMLAMGSDENIKKNIKPLDSAKKNFVNSLLSSGGVAPQASNNPFDFSQGIKAGANIAEARKEIKAAEAEEAKKKETRDPEVKNFIDTLTPYQYDYTDPNKFGQGKHVSVMAQDLEKSPLGSQMVVNTPNGKMVDYGKGFGAMLATMADLNNRVKKMES